MAIARGTPIQATIAGGTATLTQSVTLTDNFMRVGFTNQNTGAISSVAWGATPLTLVDSQSDGNSIVYLYELQGATPGTANLTITRASSSFGLFTTIRPYTGVKSSFTPVKTKSTGMRSTMTGTITVVDANSWADMSCYCDNGSAAASTNATIIGSLQNGSNVIHVDNQSLGAIPAGSFGMTVTGALGNLSLVMASISPAVSVTNSRMLDFF
jgi:hypothetical protein